MQDVRLGHASVRVLPVVRGLPSGGPAVLAALESAAPRVIALSIAPEEVRALREYRGGPVPPEGFEEEAYVAGLAEWEQPVKPAPCFAEAIRAADVRGIPVEGIDMNEEAYTDAYTRCVSALELILQGRTEARLHRRKLRAKTPEEFVLAWDAEVNRPAGFARLQREREAHMASRVKALAAVASPVLAVLEVERAAGVLAALRA